jgi:hypothetical protein
LVDAQEKSAITRAVAGGGDLLEPVTVHNSVAALLTELLSNAGILSMAKQHEVNVDIPLGKESQ